MADPLTNEVRWQSMKLAMRESSAFYGLRDWAWGIERMDRARFVRDHRPFVGFNPLLERVTNG